MKQQGLFILTLGLVLFSATACLQVSSYDEAPSAPVMSAKEPHRFLQKYLGFSKDDLIDMEQGEVVAKVFDAKHVENEVGAFGVVRMNIPKKFFVEQFRDIVEFTESDAVLQIGKFSNPPTLDDIQELTIKKSEIDDIKRCEPGACKLKMDTAMMERFQHEVDWEAEEYQEQATALMKEILVEYAAAYLQKGDTALGEYHDQEEPVSQAEAFQGLLRYSPYISEHVPELYSYLQQFPNSKLPNVENFLYWCKEIFSMKPVISLYHVTIYTREQQGSTDVFIASKQIYASHYFETSLGFTAFVDEVGGVGEPDSYLMYLNRSRFDRLRGSLKGLIVALAKNRVYDGVIRYFKLVKERLEAAQKEQETAVN